MAFKISALGLKMGLAANIQEAEDAQKAKDKRIEALNDAKRKWLFTSYQTDKAAQKKSVAARSAAIKQARTYGFTKEAAMLLEASGELATQNDRLKQLKKAGKLDTDQVNKMSEMVMASLKDRPVEEKNAALTYIAQGDLNFSSASEFEDEFINAIFSADPDSLKKATKLYSDVMAGGGGGGLNFGPSGLSSRSFGDYDTTLSLSVDKLIANKVSGFFGDDTITFDGGIVSYKGDDAIAAQKLFNGMSKRAKDNYYDPSVGGDWKASIDVMADNLGKQAASNIKVKDYVLSVDPDFDISTVVRSPASASQPGSVTTPAEDLTKNPFDNTIKIPGTS